MQELAYEMRGEHSFITLSKRDRFEYGETGV